VFDVGTRRVDRRRLCAHWRRQGQARGAGQKNEKSLHDGLLGLARARSKTGPMARSRIGVRAHQGKFFNECRMN
jgi:hypothetical protein